jgi:hypothetical protein
MSAEDEKEKEKEKKEQRDEQKAWAEVGTAWRQGSNEEEGASNMKSINVIEVRDRAAKFAKSIRRRNLIEYLAGVILIAFLIPGVLDSSRTPLTRAGGALMIAAAVFVLAILYKRGSNKKIPDPNSSTTSFLAFERSELDRQASLLERVWLWYVLPFAPAILAIYTDALLEALKKGTPITKPIALFAVTIAFFVFVHWLNRRAARKLRARSEKL